MNNSQLNIKKSKGHIILGLNQFKNHPTLFLLIIPFVGLWLLLAMVTSYIGNFMYPDFTVVILFLFGLVVLPILLGLLSLRLVGDVTAKKDENQICKAFSTSDLRNGPPILTYKKKNRKTGVITEIWDTSIPPSTWQEKQEDIQNMMSIHLVEEPHFVATIGCHMKLVFTEGRTPPDRGDMYDGEI